MRRSLATAAFAALAALSLAGCAGGDDPAAGSDETTSPSQAASPSESSESPSETPSETPDEPEGTVVEIEIEGDKVAPQGESVEVKAGEPITLEVRSDRAAELHVHSSPEQELEVEKGDSTLELTLDKPGIVDVEEHDSGLVILRLEVR